MITYDLNVTESEYKIIYLALYWYYSRSMKTCRPAYLKQIDDVINKVMSIYNESNQLWYEKELDQTTKEGVDK